MAPPTIRAKPDLEEKLEASDIQGLVVRGFGKLKEARFLLLQLRDPSDPEPALHYLRTLCAPGRINTAHAAPHAHAIQVAFTAPGLRHLGVPGSAYRSFSREFLEGMDDPVRAVPMGDQDANDPIHWTWGRQADDKVHVLLMIYADTPTTLTNLLGKELPALARAFLVVEKESRILPDNKEHFGWRDGLSMPKVEGVTPQGGSRKKQQTWTDPAIRPGEFVLGYKNEYDCYSESPTVDRDDDPTDQLPDTKDPAQKDLKDLGKNGTYLVYREIEQHVPELWRHLAEHSREPGTDPPARAIALGAKLVGRWPGGAPLVTSPDRDDPKRALDNEFNYRDKDPVGLACPLGAHIRRANPRDHLAEDRDAGDSAIMVRKHQMIRRGRAFGPPVAASMDPREILTAATTATTERRGLHFICLVGHIGRQFEFVQRAWIHSANFAGLFKDGDPISAARRPHDDENANDEFTCPAVPLRRKYKALPQFTTLVGGAYFFLPGLRALRFITRHP